MVAVPGCSPYGGDGGYIYYSYPASKVTSVAGGDGKGPGGGGGGGGGASNTWTMNSKEYYTAAGGAGHAGAVAIRLHS